MVVILGKAYNLTHNFHIVHFSFKSTRLCIKVTRLERALAGIKSQIDTGSSPGFTANRLQALELQALLAVLSHSKTGLNEF